LSSARTAESYGEVRGSGEMQLLNAQLVQALNDRIVIEQATGVLVERAGLDIEAAFSRMRKRARDQNLKLVDVARGIVDGPSTLR